MIHTDKFGILSCGVTHELQKNMPGYWRNLKMKVGDLVRSICDGPPLGNDSVDVGIVIEVIDHIEVPPVVKVLWHDGTIDKEWTDELQEVYG
jgi:hypothetical protein